MLREFITEVVTWAYDEGWCAVFSMHPNEKEEVDELRKETIVDKLTQWEDYKTIENLVEPKNHVGKRTKEHIKGIIELMTESDETECEPTLTFSHADIALITDALANYIGENNE